LLGQHYRSSTVIWAVARAETPCQHHPLFCQIEMSSCEGRSWMVGLAWIRCCGDVAVPGTDPKTAATGLAPKQAAPSPYGQITHAARV
jgi:hypothetical protein